MCLRRTIGWFRALQSPLDARRAVGSSARRTWVGVERWRDPALTATLIVLLLAALLYPYRHGHSAQVADTRLVISDFAAFYCGALVLRQGEDPYLLAPLKACEVERVYRPGGQTYEQHGGIDTAPQAPYTLMLYEPFTALGYRVAGLLWLALLVVATLVTAAWLGRLIGQPYWLALAFLAPGSFICFIYGQTQPLVTLALVASALLLKSGKPAWAAAALALTLINPQVGLPAVLAILLWSPRGRAAAIGLCLAVAGISLAAGGWALNAEYYSRALPAQGFAEITVPFQYSLTALLSALGVADGPALRLGSLQYAAMATAGVLLAGPLARRIGSPALVLFPPACAVLGGLYIHLTQLQSAVPFALYLAANVPESAAWAWLGAALVALPWPAARENKLLLGADAAIVFATLSAIARRSSLGRRALAAAAVFGLYVALGPLERRVPPIALHGLEPPSSVAAAGYDPRLAGTEEAVFARADPAQNGAKLSSLLERIPGWFGLIMIFAAGVAARTTKVEH